MASVLPQASAVFAQRRAATRTFVLAAAVAALVAVLVVHYATAASIVAIWRRSDTFAHGFAVVPICLWLGWRLRGRLASVALRPWWPGLAIVLAAGILWFAGSLADVNGPRQFALAFMLQATMVTIAGLACARLVAFPLVFLLFAVPAGEFLLPMLIDHTADFTVAALRLSGVPVYREANHFVIPSGAWSVVEACSGLRYLVASLMVGSLFAALSYRSAGRRAAFVAASIAVPIVANWLRAYMIVMIAHLTNNQLAIGVDHLIYGWLFFGVIMGLLFWIGSLWSEPPVTAASRGARPVLPANASRGAFGLAAAACVAVAAATPALVATLDRTATPGVPVVASVAEAGGWQPGTTMPSAWAPDYRHASASRRQAFVRGDDVAGVHIAYYRHQDKGHELVTSGNAIGSRSWRVTSARRAALTLDGAPITAARATVDAEAGPLAVWHVWWVGGVFTSSPLEAKARLAWSRLRGEGDDGALVAVFAAERDGRDVAREAFIALAPSIERALQATRDTR